jgi:hypothetical protein
LFFTIYKVHSFPTQFGFEIALVPKPCHTLWALNQLSNSTCPVHIELYQHPPSSGQTFMKLICNLMVDTKESSIIALITAEIM